MSVDCDIEKKIKTLFDVYGSSRAFATSAMGPSLRASSYALPIPLVTSLSLLQTSKSKNIGFSSLKNRFMINHFNIDVNLECVHMTSLSVQIISFALIKNRSKVV